MYIIINTALLYLSVIQTIPAEKNPIHNKPCPLVDHACQTFISFFVLMCYVISALNMDQNYFIYALSSSVFVKCLNTLCYVVQKIKCVKIKWMFSDS